MSAQAESCASSPAPYSALQDGVAHVVLQKEGRTRVVRVLREPFTLVAATTRPEALSAPLRPRFPLRERLEHYGKKDLCEVVLRRAERLGSTMSAEAALEVPCRSKGTVRFLLAFCGGAGIHLTGWGGWDEALGCRPGY